MLTRVPLAIATVVAMVVIAMLDRSVSDDAGQVTLGAILVAAAGLGAMAPRRPWVPGFLLGSVLACVHLAMWVAGVPEATGAHLAAGVLGPASLLVLAGPALVAAYIGAGLRRLLGRGRR